MMVTADGTFQSVSGPFLLAIEIFTAIINVTYSYRVELGTIHSEREREKLYQIASETAKRYEGERE